MSWASRSCGEIGCCTMIYFGEESAIYTMTACVSDSNSLYWEMERDLLCGLTFESEIFTLHAIAIREAGPFVPTQTGPGDHFRLPNWQKWSPGPILVAKFGPARTSFGKIGPFLATKSGPGWTIFGCQNRSGGPLLGRTTFRVTVPWCNYQKTHMYADPAEFDSDKEQTTTISQMFILGR